MDLVHVDDVIAGLQACAAAREKNEAGIYTLGSGRRLSVRSLVDAVGRLRGGTLDMRWGELPNGSAPVIPRPADRPPPGWQVRVALEDGLKQVVSHG
jgi:nucleoside-diphosphate-sugar epimerase